MRTRRSLLVLAAAALTEACKGSEFSCTDTSGLSPDDVLTRTNVLYVDRATDKSKKCEKCSHFIAAKDCGTCKLVKGPIHPEGSCKAFVLKP